MTLQRQLGLAALLLAFAAVTGCAQEKLAPGLDPDIVGKWRPVSINGRPFSDEDAKRSLYVVKPSGRATLALSEPLRQYITYQKLTTANGRLTIHNRLSRRDMTVPYTIDGDHLTIGEGDTVQEYVRK